MYVSCYSLNSPLLPQMVENLPAMRDTQVRPLGQDRSPGEGKDNPPQRSCLERPVDRGAWLPQSLGSRRIKDNRVTTFLSIHVTTDFCYYFLKISLSLSFQKRTLNTPMEDLTMNINRVLKRTTKGRGGNSPAVQRPRLCSPSTRMSAIPG